MAMRQHRETTTISAPRGTITDRTGEPLAIGEQARRSPRTRAVIRNPRRVALVGGQDLGIDPNDVYASIADRHARGSSGSHARPIRSRPGS